MKKIFTLALALIAMVAVNAQVLFSEDFENGIPTTWLNIDADNDGNTWMEGTAPGVSGHNGSNGCAYSCSYFNSTALTPDNWLITPAINLTANANLTFWVAAQDASYAAEHYGVYISTTGTATNNFTLLFEETLDANGGARAQGIWKQKTVDLSNYTGQTVYIAFRHFNCTDMFYIDLDDVEISAIPTDPTIIAQPTTLDFGTLPAGTSQTQTVNLVTYNLTAGVTATTTAPYGVSADGTTFGTTATVAATGGTLYVKYAPATMGTDSGSITLSSTGATDVTITLAGEAIDCNVTIPYTYAFDNENQALCWSFIDANNDGYTFGINTTSGVAYYSYNTSADADDWLLSPFFALTGAQLASIDYRAASTSYPERFQAFAIGADTVALSPVINVTSNEFQTLYMDLSNLTGNYQIAFHCISDTNMYNLYLTDFSIIASGEASISVNPDAIDFGTVPMNDISGVEEFEITAISVTDPITISVTAPFEVSIDNSTFGATATIPASTSMVDNYTVYVRFAPTAVGSFSQNVTLTAGTLSDTIALTGSAVDCSNGITTFPFVYDFNTGFYPPMCWYYTDAEHYWRATVDGDAGDYAMYVDDIDMLVTPEITSTSDIALLFDYRNYLGDNIDDQPSSFRVGYSTTSGDHSNFTWFPAVTVASYPDDDALFFTYSANIPANAKHIAIDFLSFASYLSGYYEDVIYIDNFKLITDSYMAVTPETINFGNVIFGTTSDNATVNVTSALLSNSISINAPANFEVSTNGVTFAATATLPQEGGSFYVRYIPTSAGSHTGNITVTSGSISKTIAVSGNAVDCSAAQALPFFDGFEDGISACYRNIDNDGDGYIWYDNLYTEWQYDPYEGNGCAMSASYINGVGALNPDNFLITPALAIPAQGAKVSWYVAAQDGGFPAEYYDVMVSNTPDNLNSFTTIFSETLESEEWEARTVNIPSSFNGQTAYVAFRHHDATDMFWMKIDNLSVTAGVGIENHEVNTTIYPNPANNVLNISATENINRVEVYNMMGQLVGAFVANDVKTQINTTHFANGVYTVKIETENGMSTKKFTVAR